MVFINKAIITRGALWLKINKNKYIQIDNLLKWLVYILDQIRLLNENYIWQSKPIIKEKRQTVFEEINYFLTLLIFTFERKE